MKQGFWVRVATLAPTGGRPGEARPLFGSVTGYFDQAHFGHEFRAFTGLTPTLYVEVRRRFPREHPGHALDSRPLPAD
jgi:hypothetical protein